MTGIFFSQLKPISGHCLHSLKLFLLFSFQPFSVDTVPVTGSRPRQAKHNRDKVQTWMEIQAGDYPDTRPVTGTMNIGDPLTILIHIRDDSNNDFDAKALDCWAFDSQPFQDEERINKVQLTTKQGCPV